jgi:hypothetical protein
MAMACRYYTVLWHRAACEVYPWGSTWPVYLTRMRVNGWQMLYEHSGRVGFEALDANPLIPTPPKAIVCAMLRRETELRNAPATQRLLDRIDRDECTAPEEYPGQPVLGEVQTLEAARGLIYTLRTELASQMRISGGSLRERDRVSCSP